MVCVELDLGFCARTVNDSSAKADAKTHDERNISSPKFFKKFGRKYNEGLSRQGPRNSSYPAGSSRQRVESVVLSRRIYVKGSCKLSVERESPVRYHETGEVSERRSGIVSMNVDWIKLGLA